MLACGWQRRQPARVREWLPALAAMLAAMPPRHVPTWLARLAAGEHLIVVMTQARRFECESEARPRVVSGASEVEAGLC